MPNELPGRGDQINFLDCETLPATADNPVWLSIQKWLDEDVPPEEREEARVKFSALYAELATVWMIGIAEGSNDPVIFSGDGSPEAEKGVLTAFYEHVKDHRNPWWVGHNVARYDIPLLQVRALRHGLPKLARLLSPLNLKPWETRVLDTLALWPQTNGSRESKIVGCRKLDTICALLGIEQQSGVMGHSIYEAWLKGDRSGAEDHLRSDVIQVREVFKKIWPLL